MELVDVEGAKAGTEGESRFSTKIRKLAEVVEGQPHLCSAFLSRATGVQTTFLLAESPRNDARSTFSSERARPRDREHSPPIAV